MKIDTLEDWNLILGGCGCCPMPTCPTPEKECESIEIPFTCYFVLPDLESVTEEERDCRRFAKKVYGYLFEQEENDNPEAGDFFSRTENTITTDEAKYDAGEFCYFCSNSIDYSLVEITDYPSQSRDEKYEAYSTSVCGLSCSGTQTYTDYNDSGNNYTDDFEYCVPIKFEADNDYTRSGDAFTFVEVSGITTITITNSYEDELDADFAVTVLNGKSFDEDVNGESCTSEIETDPDCPETVTTARKSRFRWKVPDSHTGSYFKIIWDVIEEPVGWDDPSPTVSRSFVSQDNTWEWTGSEDLYSGWYEITPPTVAGITRVVNVRYECYKSTKFGTRPQLLGDQVEL